MATDDKKPTVHEAKPDVMASRAPYHVTRPVEEKPGSGVEVGLPHYHEDNDGLLLNHRLYVADDPQKEYRFCSKSPERAARHRTKGFVATRDAKGADVIVAGMQLCERPIGYKQAHDKRLYERTMDQSRRTSAKAVKQEAVEKLGIPESLVSASERIDVETV